MRDLTKGKTLTRIIQFTLPILIGNIFQLFYSLADTRIVGMYLKDEALAGVGATGSLNGLIIGFLIGMTNGFALITARAFGAKDEKKMRRAVAATFEIGIVIVVLITVLGIVFLKPILRLLNTPEDIIPISVRYFRIILSGIAFAMLYNICAALLRAIGNTVVPLIFLMISSLTNVGLDILFVRFLNFNVEGAAIATIVSQGLSFGASFVYLWKKYPILRFGKQELIVSKGIAGELLPVGISMGLMSSLVNIGSVTLQSVINSCGHRYIVAHTAARKVTEFFMLPFATLSMTMGTFSGQNIGAGYPKRVKKGLHEALGICFVWSAFVVLMAYTLAPMLIKGVTATLDHEVIKTGALYLRVNTPLYFVCASVCMIRNCMQGIGDSVTPIISSGIELVGKVLIAVLLSAPLGYYAVMISEPVVWVFMVIPLLIKIRSNPHLKGVRAGE